MELVIAGAVILVPLLVIAIVLAVAPVRRAADRRDESVRAGRSAAATPEEATRKAEGTTAWMRPYGGGV